MTGNEIKIGGVNQMAGTETSDHTLNVSNDNTEASYAVQGESNSRILKIHLVHTVTVTNESGQTGTQQEPLDLTGCSCRLYIKKPDGTNVMIDGNVVDPTGNTVLFVLPDQALVASGTADCTVSIISPGSTALKATGFTLTISDSDMEETVVSSDDFMSLVQALGSVTNCDNAASAANAAADRANQTIDEFDSKVDARISAQKDTTGGITKYETFTSHDTDSIRHITAAERTKWNNAVPVMDDGTGDSHYEKYNDGRIHEWGGYVEDIAYTTQYQNIWFHSDTNDTHVTLPVAIDNGKKYFAHVSFGSTGILFNTNTFIQNSMNGATEKSDLYFRAASGAKVTLTTNVRWEVWGYAL